MPFCQESQYSVILFISFLPTLTGGDERACAVSVREVALAMVFKLLMSAEKRWRRLNGYRLLDKVVQGVIFKDGIDPEKAAKQEAS